MLDFIQTSPKSMRVHLTLLICQYSAVQRVVAETLSVHAASRLSGKGWIGMLRSTWRYPRGPPNLIPCNEPETEGKRRQGGDAAPSSTTSSTLKSLTTISTIQWSWNSTGTVNHQLRINFEIASLDLLHFGTVPAIPSSCVLRSYPENLKYFAVRGCILKISGDSLSLARGRCYREGEAEMAQAMRTMQVTAMNGALAGASQKIDTSVSLRISKRNPKSRRTALSMRASVKDEHDALAVVAPATVTSIVVLADAGAANALTAEDVTGAYLKVQSVASQVTQTAGDVFGVAKNVFQQVFTTVKPAVDVATPYVQKSADYAIKSVVPFATDLEKQAEQALQSNGLNTKPVLDAAKTAVTVAGEAAGQAEKYIEGAQPSISSTVENVLSSDPLVLATGAGALLLLYFLAPPLLSSVSYALRGFKGELTALQALDLLSKEDYILIDVRSEKEKSKSGVPSLPRNAKNKFLLIPIEELPGKLRGQLRNVRKVEAEITALKIASLKRINKGSRLVIIDSNGDVAKVIARSLSGLGFNKTWIITDGFDGRRGWVQSRLGTESSKSSFAEILSPSRIIPAGTSKRLLSSSANNDVVDVGTSRLKLLPGSPDE